MPSQQPSFAQQMVMMLPFIVILLVMLYLPWSAQRKERKKKEEMLASLKKGQKVRTIGGLLGEVSEVKDKEVVLLVDPRTDTRLTFSKASIAEGLDP